MFVSFIIKFVITMTILATVISFYDIFIKHQHIVFVAKRIVRAIEVSGANDSAITTLFNQLCTEMGLTGASLTVVPDGGYHPSGLRRVQLRQRFTVTIRFPMRLRMAQFGDTPLQIPITLESRLVGMSEVFWR